jgi:ribonuclease HII
VTIIRDIATLGIDEAGRGPVLGPLVMAGVVVRPRKAASLTRAGVTDSKAFGAGPDAHARRTELAAKIRELAESVVVRVIDVAEIDRRVRLHQLNHLEREVATEIIQASAPADKIYADGERMFAALAETFPHFFAKDRAEEVHVAVAAASVVAKARRDELFGCIARRYEHSFGPIAGGGYDNVHTHSFLRAFVDRHGRLPPEARQSWAATASYLQLGLFPVRDFGAPTKSAKGKKSKRAKQQPNKKKRASR